MRFTKMHGCGNDYIYMNAMEETIRDPAGLAKRISDRHKGIGADGMILIGPSRTADFQMKMYNADGSEGEMCGNGIRCLGKYVYEKQLTGKTELTIETKAGIRKLSLKTEDHKVTEVRVDMGKPVFDVSKIPVTYPEKYLIRQPVTILDCTWYMTCLSMGNPHAVVYVPDTSSFKIEKYGPVFEHYPIFPKRINTEFVQVLGRNELNMRVWERGSGETLSCGTGTCACVMASILNGLTDHNVTVHTLGGDLMVEYEDETRHLFLTGPAELVYEGEIQI